LNGYDLSGRLVSHDDSEFDDKHRKIRWTSRSYFEHEDHSPHRWTYSYDDQDCVKEEKAYIDAGSGFAATDRLGSPHRKLHMYHDPTRSGATVSFDSSGAFAGSELSTYDSKGNELEDIEFDANGVLKRKTKYEYVFDSFGNWTVQKTYEWNTEKGKSYYRLQEIEYQLITYFH
jgi:hypothetical protein